MSTNQTIYFSRWGGLYTVLGCVFLGLGGLVFAVDGPWLTQLVAGGFMLFLGLRSTSQPLVELSGDHVVIKLAPLAPQHMILYADIQAVERPEPMLLVIKRRDAPELKLGLGIFRQHEVDPLVAALTERAGGKGPAEAAARGA